MKTAVIVTQTSRWKLHFLEKHHFCFFLYGQPRRLNKKVWRFHEKNGRVVKTAYLVSIFPIWTFFEKKRNFSEKICFYQFGTWGKKYWSLLIFLPLLCQNFILTVHTFVLTVFFEKLTIFLLTFWHLTFWQKVKKLFFNSLEDWATSFSTLDETFPVG